MQITWTRRHWSLLQQQNTTSDRCLKVFCIKHISWAKHTRFSLLCAWLPFWLLLNISYINSPMIKLQYIFGILLGWYTIVCIICDVTSGESKTSHIAMPVRSTLGQCGVNEVCCRDQKTLIEPIYRRIPLFLYYFMDLYINFKCGGPAVCISRNLVESYINKIYFSLYDYKISQTLQKTSRLWIISFNWFRIYLFFAFSSYTHAKCTFL